MKKIFLLLINVLAVTTLFAQNGLETSRDAAGTKVLKGFIPKSQLISDTAFSWYAQNAKAYTPAPETIRQFTASKDSVSFIIFGGTWCGDTKHLLPQFFTTTDAAGFPDNHITLIGVDHNKKTLYNLSETFGITNVPTFIVMKNGKEIGRVVEYGKIGAPDKEVAQIIAAAK